MANYSISLGDKVDVIRQMYAKKDADDIYFLGSKVVDVIDEVTLKLTMPMNKTITIPLEVGEETLMYFYTSYGILAGRTVVTDRFFEGSIAVIIVELITELEKTQRRQYYRLPCSIDARIHILTDEEKKGLNNFIGNSKLAVENKNRYVNLIAENAALWEDCLVVDLSGGGVKYLSDRERAKDEMIILGIELRIEDNFSEYFFLMRVISSLRKSVESTKYEIRTKFTALKDADRETIVRFIFEEERRNRSKNNV